MPSNLRQQTSVDNQSTESYFPMPTMPSPQAKKQRMSLSQTYQIASSARNKLGREAARADHQLRLLVGHANLLDSLMIELANSEREQESYFNQSLRSSRTPEAPRHVQWIDTISEDDEEDLDSDSDSDYDDEDIPAMPTSRRASSPPPTAYSLARLIAAAEEDEEMDDEDFDEEHALTRTASHPPELIHEDSEDSDDDSMPPSPPASSLAFEESQRLALETSKFFQKAAQNQSRQPQVITEDLVVASRNSNQVVAAY